MDRAALNELFDFTTFTWEVYRRSSRRLPFADLQRPVEGSGWPSAAKALVHVASAWDGWLSERAGAPFTEFDIDAVSSWDDVQAMREQTRGWLRRILDETSDGDLHEPTVPTWQGTPTPGNVAPAVILSHILLHERGHHGDISTLLEQAGVRLGGSDYLIYLWFKRNAEMGDPGG